MVIEYGVSEYSTDDLTKKQYAMVMGIQAVLDDIEAFACDYVIDEDASVMDKLKCEVAQEVLSELHEHVESNLCDTIISMVDENVCKILSMSRSKAEKKFGERFVSEVLDE